MGWGFHIATAVLTAKYTFPELIFPNLQFPFHVGTFTHNYFLILIIMEILLYILFYIAFANLCTGQ